MPVNVRKIQESELKTVIRKKKGNNEQQYSIFPIQAQNDEKKSYSLVADRVEVVVGGEFVSRRDMWQLVQYLHHKTVYKGNLINYSGIRFKIRNCYTSQSPTPFIQKQGDLIEQKSAIVLTNYTKFSFLTKSCQKYIMIEMSKEMFGFDSEGYL